MSSSSSRGPGPDGGAPLRPGCPSPTAVAVADVIAIDDGPAPLRPTAPAPTAVAFAEADVPVRQRPRLRVIHRGAPQRRFKVPRRALLLGFF
jgi:hypothetical protein